MIRQAALYLVSDDDLRAARLTVAGRSLAFRTIVTAVRAGIRRIGVPAVLRTADLETALATSPRTHAALLWLDTGALAAEPTLLLPVAALAPASALARLLQAPPGCVLAESRAGEVPVLTIAAPLLAGLEASLVAGTPLGTLLAREVAARRLPPVAGQGWFTRLSGQHDVAAATALLWSDLGSSIDTWLDVALHRRLSRGVTRAAVTLGMSANSITVASGVVGLAAAALVAQGTLLTLLGGVVLYLTAVVLDHADGEVARLTLTESTAGEWLDIAVDTVVHAALVLALGVAAARLTSVGFGAGVVGAVGVVASATAGKLWPPAPAAAGARRVLDPLTSRDGFYAMLLIFIALHLAAPAWLPALMLVVAVGTHAYWLARAVLSLTPGWVGGRRL